MRIAAFRDQNPEFTLFSAHILSQSDTLPAKGEENSGKIFNDKKRLFFYLCVLLIFFVL